MPSTSCRKSKNEAARPLGAVIPDRLDGAAFLGLSAPGFLFLIFRLLINERIAAVIVAFEIIRSRFAAEIAINALIVHVIFSSGVFGVFICRVCHKKRVPNMERPRRLVQVNFARERRRLGAASKFAF